jgi:hypothetical protein
VRQVLVVEDGIKYQSVGAEGFSAIDGIVTEEEDVALAWVDVRFEDELAVCVRDRGLVMNRWRGRVRNDASRSRGDRVSRVLRRMGVSVGTKPQRLSEAKSVSTKRRSSFRLPLQTQVAQSGVIVGTASQRPMVFPLVLQDA